MQGIFSHTDWQTRFFNRKARRHQKHWPDWRSLPLAVILYVLHVNSLLVLRRSFRTGTFFLPTSKWLPRPWSIQSKIWSGARTVREGSKGPLPFISVHLFVFIRTCYFFLRLSVLIFLSIWGSNCSYNLLILFWSLAYTGMFFFW